jgi:hypothetical protein
MPAGPPLRALAAAAVWATQSWTPQVVPVLVRRALPLAVVLRVLAEALLCLLRLEWVSAVAAWVPQVLKPLVVPMVSALRPRA